MHAASDAAFPLFSLILAFSHAIQIQLLGAVWVVCRLGEGE